ncbi:MAG: PBP1A family penicillin-binding protein [Candidatus Andersenbacteria bacterium]
MFTSHTLRTYRSYDITYSREGIMNNRDTGLILLDRNGEPFFTFYEPRLKTFIPLHEVPLPARQAVIAAEDKEFYRHRGFSARGIIRSAYINYYKKTLVTGGSTITQQLVKNSFLSPVKSLRRKYHEILLAVKLERYFTKDEILEMYINSAYFGEGVFGIEEAARVYFNKSARDLTVSEASMVAGLLPAPSNYSPLNGADALNESKQRQRFVLNQMVIAGFIELDEGREAYKNDLAFSQTGKDINNEAPHFALLVRDQLIKEFGEEFIIRSGFRVQTTLDRTAQRYAQETLSQYIPTLASKKVTNGAAVIIDPPTGEVRALVGSVDWNREQFGKINMAISPRQTGSAFKPIVYAAAFEQGALTPSSLLPDLPKTYGKNYRPVNYDGKFRGRVSVRQALGNSLNVPAVETTQRIGPARVVKMAERLGITTLSKEASSNLSTALGSEGISLYELTGVYATLANSGYRMGPKTIMNIKDKHEKPVIYEQVSPYQALDSRIAFQLTSILADNDTRRQIFGNTLVVDRPAAAKTGTTQNYRDNWTVGYTPSLAVGVWIGNSNNDPLASVAGAIGAAPLWRDLMNHFLAEQDAEEFTPPAGIITARVCHNGGLLPDTAPRGMGYTEYYLPGTEPTSRCVLTTPSPSPESGEATPEGPDKKLIPEALASE